MRLVNAYAELGTETEKLRESEIALAKAAAAVVQERLKQQPTNQQHLQDLIEAKKAVDDLTEAHEKLKKEMGQGEQKAEKLLGSLFKIGGFAGKLTQVMPRSAEQMKGFTKTLSSAKLGSLALQKAGAALLNSTIALAKAQDEAISSFRQATGASKQYNYEITQTERRNFIAGVSAKDAAAGFQALYGSFSAFTQLNKSQRAALQDTTVLLQKLGVDAGTTGAIFDQVFRAAGGSVEDANDTMLEIAGTAKSLGVPMKQLANDFTSAFGTLVQYGDRANEVFKGLAVQAKNTGLSVGDLIKITAQFDTFDGAARSVGRLNAILGGPYLNSIDMLNASEEERISILTRQVEMAGIQFDALQKYEQRAIASSLGMSVEEANRLFRMGEEQYQLDALRQEELLEQSREVQTIAQELKSMFMALAVDMRPFIDNVIKPFIKGMGTIAQKLGALMNSVGPAFRMMLPAAGLAMLLLGIPTGGATVPLGLKLLALSGIIAAGGIAAAGTPKSQSSAITPSTQGGGGRSSIGGMVSRQQRTDAKETARLANSIEALNRNIEKPQTQSQQPIVLETNGEVLAKGVTNTVNRLVGGPFTNRLA